MDYIELKSGSKEPLNRHTFYESMDNLSDAGIVLDDEEGVIFIDFDNLEDNKGCEQRILSGILKEYPCSLVVNTSRGKHLYYKTDRALRQWTSGFINIGMKCDAKIGNAYAVIKQNGIVREHIGELSFDNLTPLPDILLPMVIGKNIKNLCGLKQGEGRHNTLLRHLCQIRVNYDDVDITKIANFINTYVFDDQLDDKELTNIVDSAKNYDIKYIDILMRGEGNFSKSKQRIIDLCKKIVDRYKIHISDNQIYFYENGKYSNNEKRLREIVFDEYEYSKKEYEEILFQLENLGIKEQDEKSIILLRNGALVDGKYVKDIDEFSSSYLDVFYNPDAFNRDVEAFLQFITNNEGNVDKNDLRIVLEEMIGHCLMTKNFPHKVFLLVGNGCNGKSTLMNVLFNMFGDLATNVPLRKLERDDYVARLTGKLVNISDDIDFSYLKYSQNVKTLSSGDVVPARELYSKSYYFRNKATMIFSMNELVVFSDHTYGMQRRLAIIPFANKIKNPDPSILEKLTNDDAKSYLLRLGLEGMQRIKENKGQLSYSKTIDNVVKNYLAEIDSVFSFLEYGNCSIEGEAFSSVYDEYSQYCSRSEFTPYKKKNFSQKLKIKGYVTKVKNVDGTPTRILIKEESNA